MTTTEGVELKRGLNGVYFDNTAISLIDGTNGRLFYRGYNIHDLAEKSTFEEVVYLLLYGKLPTQSQLQEMVSFCRESRAIPSEIIGIINTVKDAHPMDVLRTAVSALSTYEPEVDDQSPDAVRRKGLRLMEQTSTIVTTHFRIKRGLDSVAPSPSLNFGANFLYMLFSRQPGPDDARIMDVDFILHAEHGSNASSFAVRVTAATLADLHSAVVTGLATLKGPLHGGAAEAVTKMAEGIGSPGQAEAYVKRIISGGGRVMGFGHRVYKVEDPRVRHVRAQALALSEKRGHPEWSQILEEVAKAMEPYQKRGIYANVDFYTGVIYRLLGITENFFVPIFAIGRIPGYVAQAMEQYEHNILIRPLLNSIGEKDLQYVPIEKR